MGRPRKETLSLAFAWRPKGALASGSISFDGRLMIEGDTGGDR
jgi:hypothetical protein